MGSSLIIAACVVIVVLVVVVAMVILIPLTVFDVLAPIIVAGSVVLTIPKAVIGLASIRLWLYLVYERHVPVQEVVFAQL